MNWMTSDAIAVLSFLLPGFLASKAFRTLTRRNKPDAFGWLVEALAFTALIHAIMLSMPWFADLAPYPYVLWATILALVLAFSLAWLAQRDLFNWLRRLRITAETSHPSEWYAAFWQNTDCYVVLHLRDDRRLFGWPHEWPGDSDNGHFLMRETEWLVGDERVPMEGVDATLIPASDVGMVEFVKARSNPTSTTR